jgi:hypothetical protein
VPGRGVRVWRRDRFVDCCNLDYEVDAGVLQCVRNYGTFDLNGNPLVSGIPPLQKFTACATSYGVYVTY